MDYIGEHLWPGQLGHFFVVLSLVASLVASIAYYRASNTAGDAAHQWKLLARTAFLIDAISVLAIFSLIFFIISHHYFEYHYAWNHSDTTLEPKYLLSSIWEGQEGSFLLWTLWHGVLGAILMRTAGKYEAPVMTVISLVQFVLATMILGVYVFDIKIGNNPFVLVRDSGALDGAPFFFDSETGLLRNDYLQFILQKGGNGLNQLLQNYWMVIHPPVLFLGFASTIVPFAYAMAGLWKKDFTGWTKSALPWCLFSGAILGLGIMMGAKWAYESLTFGGYWAWDPVENASLVPWFILVAGIHTLVIFNSTGHSLRPTYFFLITAFLLVLYSTYLTRSGDLQDTSVHAFTGSGMNWHLRAFVFLFLLPAIILYVRRYRSIPFIAKEENTYSREFWMFIGSLVLFLSSLFIILFTSLPVVNKVLGTKFTIGEDREFFYNRIQVFVAIVLGILTATTQYLKYRNTEKKTFGRKILWPTVIAIAISIAIALLGNVDYEKYGAGFLVAIHLAIFAGVYAVIANGAYLKIGLHGKLKAAGASIAHVGFGIFLVGVLISSAKKEVLSMNFINPLNFGADAKEKGVENLTLFQGIKTDMGKFWATYARDTTDEKGKTTYFHIEMEKKDSTEKFTLYPDLIKNTKGQEGFSNNPDSKHYWNKDIFSYINYTDKMMAGEDTSRFRSSAMEIGDTIFYSGGFIVLNKVSVNPSDARHQFHENDTAIRAELAITALDGRKDIALPVYYLRNNQANYILDTVYSQGLAIGLSRVVDARHIEISVKESSRLTPFVALKILQFPFINLVWLGTVLMVSGFIISLFYRLKLLRNRTVRL
ncbi:MAG TPA: cytochrome c biogenesis protein CcsA [Flavitalea sp.]|nr:cytochrome c biogenesis protein CcsA [Flavitalea sp.]